MSMNACHCGQALVSLCQPMVTAVDGRVLCYGMELFRNLIVPQRLSCLVSMLFTQLNNTK